MDSFIHEQTVNLLSENSISIREQPIVKGDGIPLIWRVRIFCGASALDLSDASAKLYCARAVDPDTGEGGGTTFSDASPGEDGIVLAELPEDAANVPGTVACTLRIVLGGRSLTVARMAVQAIDPIGSDIVDVGKRIPDLDEVLASIERCEQAAKAARDAADAAYAAAEAAEKGAGDADEAAGRAILAASGIESMTVSAQSGADADAEISEQDGVKHIHFTLPTGATPDIKFEVSTGAAGTDVQLQQSGTPEHPVIHLIIPRGDTGNIDGLDYYEGNPAALGIASAGTANGVARGNHVHPMPNAEEVGARPDTWMPTASDVGARPDSWTPTAKEVGARPDNWTPTAAEVGALPAEGTAVNAAALGGKAPAYYIRPINLLDNGSFARPVNQRGVSGTISTAGYFLDRWKLVSGSVTIGEDGITLDGTISQILERAPSGAVTAASSAGSASFDADTSTYSLTAAGELIVWAALYEGAYTADNLPPYVPKPYAAELLECQRYYYNIGSVGNYQLPIAHGICTSSTAARFILTLPIAMRDIPALAFPEGDLSIADGTDFLAFSALNVQNVRGNALYLSAAGSGFAAKHPCELRFVGVTGEIHYVEFSAEL